MKNNSLGIELLSVLTTDDFFFLNCNWFSYIIYMPFAHWFKHNTVCL